MKNKKLNPHPYRLPTIINKQKLYALTTTISIILLILLFTICPPSKSTYHLLFLHLSSNSSSAHHLQTLTLHPHIAGSSSNAIAAAYVLQTLSSSSIPTHIIPYHVLLSYPIHRHLSLSSNPTAPPVPFDLVQQTLSVAAEVTPSFHAYARSGTAAGQVVYANYGRVEDFAVLRETGVEVVGSVVVARYGGIFRGDIVRNAEIAGAIAAILYTDARDYGGGGRGKWFPEDRWMPPSGVQLGSVFRGLGDPTTPGWASVGDCERVSVEEVVAEGLMPGIPSLPVSSRDGESILRTVGGEVARDDWQGEEGAPVYRLGPGPGFVNLSYLVSFGFFRAIRDRKGNVCEFSFISSSMCFCPFCFEVLFRFGLFYIGRT